MSANRVIEQLPAGLSDWSESASARPDAGTRVALLGGFRLACGNSAPLLPRGSQRLVAFLALHGGTVRRDLMAGRLWPDASECRAHASLRSCLVRLCTLARDTVEIDPVELSLAGSVLVDLDEARVVARRLLDPSPPIDPATAAKAIALLSAELLPGWYEDWAQAEAESWRQLRLHALEAAADLLADARRFADAVMGATAAVAADPLRESAQAALIRVHLAAGNQSEAIRQFGRYRDLLQEELGLAPTEALSGMMPGRPAR